MADSTVREIITLQFGHYSNFVGTHWWNIQESSFCYDPSAPKTEIRHECLFREGLTLDGQETFTPRLIVYDLKGSLRGLPQEGLLYDNTSDRSVAWEGELSVHQTNPDPKNEFQTDIEDPMVDDEAGKSGTGMDLEQGTSDSQDQGVKFYDLDRDISVWSDYLGTQLHPRSVNMVGEYLHNADTFPFDLYGYGQSLYREESFRDQFEDGLHFFVEQCDSLQGFQILVDAHNGFGGMASQVLEDLLDEYKSKSLLTFGCVPSSFQSTDTAHNTRRILNMALSFSNLSQNSSLFVPLSLNKQIWSKPGSCVSFPHLNYKGDIPYHTSAILAYFLDTVTLPYRLDTAMACGMTDLINKVAFAGRNIANASISMPLPISHDNTLASLLNSSMNSKEHQLLQSVTPHVTNTRNFISQAAVIRGVPHSLIHSKPQPNHMAKNMINSCPSSTDMLNMYFQANNPRSVVNNWSTNQACGTKPPFPNIFQPQVDHNGLAIEGYSRPTAMGVLQTSMMAGLGVSASVREMLDSLVHWANKVDIRKHHEFLESGIEYDSFKESLEHLADEAQQYAMP